MPRTITSIVGKVYILVGINSQSFDTQVGYILQKYTFDKYTLEKYTLEKFGFLERKKIIFGTVFNIWKKIKFLEKKIVFLENFGFFERKKLDF